MTRQPISERKIWYSGRLFFVVHRHQDTRDPMSLGIDNVYDIYVNGAFYSQGYAPAVVIGKIRTYQRDMESLLRSENYSLELLKQGKKLYA